MAVVHTTPARLWLIRHGQTDWNAVGRIQGQTVTHLNEAGRGEAREVAGILAGMRRTFAACYASDLPRAAETAGIIAERLNGRNIGGDSRTAEHRRDAEGAGNHRRDAEGAGNHRRDAEAPGNHRRDADATLAVVEVAGLRERSFGKFEGATGAEMRAARAAAGLVASGDLADWTGMPGVETNEALYERAAGALREIAGRHAGADVVVVTHGGVMGRVLYRCLGIPDGVPRRFPLSNGICAVVEAHAEGFYLVTLADLGFLAGDPVAADTAMAPPLG